MVTRPAASSRVRQLVSYWAVPRQIHSQGDRRRSFPVQGHAGRNGRSETHVSLSVIAGVPLNMVQKWLGHAQLSTTAIYADAVGAEEKSIMAKMWG